MKKRWLNAIRTFRNLKQPRLRQWELAGLIGLEQKNISAYELGKVRPTLEKALDIANALGRRVDEVFWLEQQESLRRLAEYKVKPKKNPKAR